MLKKIISDCTAYYSETVSRSNICVQLIAAAEPSHQQPRSSFWSPGTAHDDERQLGGEIAVAPHPVILG